MANETILVVDGDTRSRKILEVSFKKSGYRVLMTETVAGAVEYLEDETPDLIVSDTELPDGDGFEFCRRIKEDPDWEFTPFLFLTDESSLPRKIKGIEIGADDYLTRPIYIKEVTTRVEVLLKKRDRKLLSEGEVEEFHGELSEITIIDLLQTIDEEGRTGVVEFERGDRTGSMTFRDGAVVDAVCGKLRGAEAVYRLMLWPGGTFRVRYHETVPGDDHIGLSTEELVIEGVRRIERWDEVVAGLPPLEGVYEPDYEKLPGFLDAVPEEVGRVVRLFDGYRTLRDVVDDSPVGDVTAAEIIDRIFQEGILEEVAAEGGGDRSSGAGRSHLANWLEDSGRVSRAVDEEGFREEDTSPGYPASGRSDDPHETQEIERDDMTDALSDELDEEQRDRSDRSEEAAEAFEEQNLDPNESGPRYMPDEAEEAEEFEGEFEGADETIDELEEAERKRREEEAKRLVEQKHQPAEQGSEGQGGAAEGEGRDGAPRIPGATRTRQEAESGAPTETEGGEAGGVERGESPGKTGIEAGFEDRGRSDTPRAHPTPGDSADEGEAGGHRSRQQTATGVGETGLEQGDSGEVPVSFETVESGGDGGRTEGSPEEPEAGPEAEGETSESAGRSMTEEAAEAVRQSARQALEDAAFGEEEWTAEVEGEVEGETTPKSGDRPSEGGRKRKDTTPYGREESSEAGEGERAEEAPAESEADARERASDEARGESSAAGKRTSETGREQTASAGAPRDSGEGRAPEESVPSEGSSSSTESASAGARAETGEAGEAEETAGGVGRAPEDIERISNNGEVVRTEYDLSKSEGAEEAASETLEGVSRTPEAADETLESDETLEGVAGMESETDSAPSDDTLDGFTGVSGEVSLEGEAGEETPSGSERGAAGGSESEASGGFGSGDEPTAEDFGWASEQNEAAETELEEPVESEDEESSGSGVRIESEAFATSGEGEAPGEEAGAERDEPEAAEELVEAGEGEVSGETSESDGGPAGREAPESEQRAEAPSESEEPAPEEKPGEREPSEPEEETEVGPDDEADDEVGDEVEDLADSSDEVSFFDEEPEQEYDWDYDEEVGDGGSGGRWAIVTVVLVVACLAAVGFLLGPFSGSGDSEAGGEEGTEVVAESEEPESPGDETESPPSDEESEESGAAAGAAEPTEESRAEAAERSKEVAAAVGDRAERTSRVLAGDDPFLSSGAGADAGTAERGPDAGAAERTGVAANEQQPDESPEPGPESTEESTGEASGSEGGGAGGGAASSGVSRVRALIEQGELSEARSELRSLEEQNPGSTAVANLYLDLASKLQLDGRVQQAKAAYRSYLDLSPEGPRAGEVRSILDRL